MGTWGITAFEDDTALEFYDDFCESEQSINDLEDCLDIVLAQKYNMDDLLMEGFIEPVNALVCAEIIATSNGKPSEKLPDDEYHNDMEIQKIDFEELNQNLTEKIKQKAKETVNKIKSDSEMHLNVLWLESESFEKWKEYLDNLISRIEQKNERPTLATIDLGNWLNGKVGLYLGVL